MDNKITIRFVLHDKKYTMEMRKSEHGYLVNTLDNADYMHEEFWHGSVEDFVARLHGINAVNIEVIYEKKEESVVIAGLLTMSEECKWRVACMQSNKKEEDRLIKNNWIAQNHIERGFYMKKVTKHYWRKKKYLMAEVE